MRWTTLGLLLPCLLVSSAASHASALCLRLPPWKCDRWDISEIDIPRQRAQARCRFAELTPSSQEAFKAELDELMQKIKKGVAKQAADTRSDPREVLLDFISSPIVPGTEEDIVPYLLEQCRLDLALFYISKWLPKEIGLGEDLFGVYPIGAHAHNDYEHESPLFNAMLLGFDSIEADIYALEWDPGSAPACRRGSAP